MHVHGACGIRCCANRDSSQKRPPSSTLPTRRLIPQPTSSAFPVYQNRALLENPTGIMRLCIWYWFTSLCVFMLLPLKCTHQGVIAKVGDWCVPASASSCHPCCLSFFLPPARFPLAAPLFGSHHSWFSYFSPPGRVPSPNQPYLSTCYPSCWNSEQRLMQLKWDVSFDINKGIGNRSDRFQMDLIDSINEITNNLCGDIK